MPSGRSLVAFVYGALVALFFAEYYLDVRSTPPGTIVDYTGAAIALGFISFLPALVIARWWGALLPLISFPIAGAVLVIEFFDDRYSAVARDRGGTSGADWFDFAFVLCMFALPATFLGAGLGHLFRRRPKRAGASDADSST